MSLLLPVLLMATAVAPQPRNTDGKPFVHPGIFYTQGDFDRMKAMVAAGKEPWKRTFEALKESRWSRPNAFSRWRGGEIGQGQFNNSIGCDGRAAHDIALLWKLTGDTAYGDKARDFLVNNSNYTGASSRGTGPLDNGKIYLLVETAEMMRDYPGWKAEDQRRFKDMLRTVFYPNIRGGDVARWGNQGLTAWHGVLAMAIFLDDRKMYDRVWNNVMGLPPRADDEPYAPGPAWIPTWPAKYEDCLVTYNNFPKLGREPNWGYDDQLRYYIFRNGQCEESSRDQPHAMYGLFQMVALAEIFWNQGDDLYGALDNRILKGCEWNLRYNLSDWEPSGYTNDESAVTFENGLYYQTRVRCQRWALVKPTPNGRGADGGCAAPKTAALMHYAVRQGVGKSDVKWLLKAVARQLENGGYESWGVGAWYYEWEGWGTLTKYRTAWQHGDPGVWRDGLHVSGAHAVPCSIKATDYDYLPTAAPHPTAKIDGKTCLAKFTAGQRMDYTLSVPADETYDLALVVRNRGALTVSVSVDGEKLVTKKIARGDGFTKVALGKIALKAGAPVLRLTVDAASGAAICGLTLGK